ncbi:MAG: hypothetical protein HZA58_03690 [Acidimicrobiia bacterium]|nr:hypothetical protein [Acidimicrobiia bacterium]
MSSSRLPVIIAAALGLAGVGAIASGVVIVATAPAPAPEATTSAVITTPAETTIAIPRSGSVDLIDDSGVLAVSVPAAWTDVETSVWIRDGVEMGPSLSAATDLAAWISGWDTPGMFVGATDQVAATDAFGDFSDACALVSTTAIEADGLAGTGEWWAGCGPGDSDFFVGVVQVPDEATIVVFQIAAVDEGIAELVEGLLATFRYQP